MTKDPLELKRLRVKCRLTLRDVESKTGISNAYLSQLESGKIKKPGFDTVVKLNEFYSNTIKDAVQKLKCPNCFSEDLKDASTRENNGIIGPGYRSYVVFSAMCCNNCGVYFKPNTNETTP